MKRTFTLSVLISLGMICSCRKQDSAAEQQLAQRKVELDAREQAFDDRMNGLEERMNELDKRVSALVEREKETRNAEATPSAAQSQAVIPDPAQVKAESDRRIQQLPVDAPALIADPSQVNSAEDEKDRLRQERLAQSQPGPEEVQRRRQRKLEATQKWRMSGAAVSPAAEAATRTPPPPIDATSPTPP
jgi:outer membrane translocation and assembly module TamA